MPEMNDKENLLLLIDASSVVLGYLIAKHGFDDPAAGHLANTLHKCGVESAWVSAIREQYVIREKLCQK